jgi:uncharacterized protein (DUF111 family)
MERLYIDLIVNYYRFILNAQNTHERTVLARHVAVPVPAPFPVEKTIKKKVN